MGRDTQNAETLSRVPVSGISKVVLRSVFSVGSLPKMQCFGNARDGNVRYYCFALSDS